MPSDSLSSTVHLLDALYFRVLNITTEGNVRGAGVSAWLRLTPWRPQPRPAVPDPSLFIRGQPGRAPGSRAAGQPAGRKRRGPPRADARPRPAAALGAQIRRSAAPARPPARSLPGLWRSVSRIGSRRCLGTPDMATSLGSNTYNRQNWEDAVSARRRRTRGRRGPAGWEAVPRAAAGSARAALRPSSAGQPEESPRAADRGPGTSAVHPATPHFPDAFFFSACRKCRQRPFPLRGQCRELGLLPTLHPSPPQKVT